jgi:hypothetical protein
MLTRSVVALIAASLVSICLSTGMAKTQKQEPRPVTTMEKVTLLRVPNGGIQPQAATDSKGTVYLLYYLGDAAHGDVYYVRSEDGVRFSKPIRVNTHPQSAIAMGNIRGAQLAIGKNARVHVAWNGSDKALPSGPNKARPMLYTRLNDSGTEFEPERNVIHKAYGLDGGGSVAADPLGNVYVLWHAPVPQTVGEANRCVWVTASSDEGKTFAPETQATREATGACGCCGMRGFCDSNGALYCLYRSAKDVVHRDTYQLVSGNSGKSFQIDRLHEWNIGGCPMSSFAFCEGKGTVSAAWETDGQVYFSRIDTRTGKRSSPVSPSGESKKRRHPVLAANGQGEVLLAWSDGVEWGKGGSVAWQVYDPDGNATAERGRITGLPVWSLVAAFVRPDGKFAVVY